MRLRFCVVALATLTLASAVHAQRRQPLGPYAEGGAVFVALNDGKRSGIDQGVGFDAVAGYAFGPFMIGAGFQRSVHDVDGADSNLEIDLAFVEPRYEFDLGAGTVTPFLFGRFGQVQERLQSSEQRDDSRGFLIGGGAGMRLQVAPALSFTLSGLYKQIAIDNEPSTAGSAPSIGGNGVTARAGFSFRFGQRATSGR